MKKLTKIEPQPQYNNFRKRMALEMLKKEGTLNVEEVNSLFGFLIEKINELTDEVNRMQGNESGTVKAIDHSPCQDKDPIQTLAAIRDRLLPLVDNTSECGDMLACTGSRTECVQGLVDQIVDQYSTLKNQNELMENAIRIFCERVEKGEVRSHKTYTNFKGILHSIKKGASDES